MLKDFTLSLELEPTENRVVQTAAIFWSHDVNTAKIYIELLRKGTPIILNKDVTVRVMMLFDDENKSEHIYTAKIEDELKGLVSITLEESMRAYVGQVTCGVYVDYQNEEKTDNGYFTFGMRRSLIDKDMPELQKLYVSDFEKALEKFKEIEKKIEQNDVVTHPELKEYTYTKTYINENINRLNSEKLDKEIYNKEIVKKADEKEITMLLDKKADRGAVDERFNSIDRTTRKNNVDITMRDLSQDVKEAMTGGSVAVVGINAVGKDNIKREAVTPEKTTFVSSVEQFLNDSNLQKNSYWSFNTNKVEIKNADGWYAYNRVKLTAGNTYSILNAKGFFSGIADIDNNIIKRFSDSDILGDFEYTPNEDVFLYVTKLKTSAKVINLPLKAVDESMYSAPFGFIKITYKGLELLEQHREIHVSRQGNKDFIKLKDAVESITNSSKNNQFTIVLHDDTYDLFAEFGGESYIKDVTQNPNKYGERAGLTLPDYVHLRGEGRTRVEFTTPAAMATEESCKRISTLNAYKNNVISNIDFVAKNTRYTIHPESGNNFHNQKLVFNDCSFEHLGNKDGTWQNTTAVACGTGSNGHYEFNRCTFISSKSKNSAGFSMHDNENQKSNTVIFNKCKTITYGDDAIRFGTFGVGNQIHYVYFSDCEIDGRIRLKEEITGSGHGNRFKIRGSGNSMTTYLTTNSVSEPLKIEFSDEVSLMTNESRNDLKKGTPVRFSSAKGFQPIGSGQKFLYCGVLIEDCKSGSKALVKFDGYLSIYDSKFTNIKPLTKIYINEGELSTTPSDDIVAYSLDTENIKLIRSY